MGMPAGRGVATFVEDAEVDFGSAAGWASSLSRGRLVSRSSSARGVAVPLAGASWAAGCWAVASTWSRVRLFL